MARAVLDLLGEAAVLRRVGLPQGHRQHRRVRLARQIVHLIAVTRPVPGPLRLLLTARPTNEPNA